MFEVGDFFHMRYGARREEFYITDVSEDFIRYCSPEFPVVSARWEAWGEFTERNPVFISSGRRTIMSFVPAIGWAWPRYKRK